MSKDGSNAITASTKVAALLAAYPELEDVLISMAPPFKRLRNPVLRRSVAKVASLRQAAAVGRIPVEHLVNTLRVAAGQEPISVDEPESVEAYMGTPPEWFDDRCVVESIDATASGDAQQMPMTEVIRNAAKLGERQTVELLTTFVPAPAIDLLRRKGFRVWALEGPSGRVRTYVSKAKPPEETGLGVV